MKQKLVRYALRAYSELIRSDIPGLSGARPARLPFLRSCPLFVMKCFVPKSSLPSISEPFTSKPTRGELRSRLEVLAKKKGALNGNQRARQRAVLLLGERPSRWGPNPCLRLLSGLVTLWEGRMNLPSRFSLSRSGVPRRWAPLPLLQCQMR